jgi:hypothetical protein
MQVCPQLYLSSASDLSARSCPPEERPVPHLGMFLRQFGRNRYLVVVGLLPRLLDNRHERFHWQF